MDKLDDLVTSSLVDRLFEPRRLADVLSALSARRPEKANTANNRILELQRSVSDTEDKFERLYKLVEDGVAEIDDVLKDRLKSFKTSVIEPRQLWNGQRRLAVRQS